MDEGAPATCAANPFHISPSPGDRNPTEYVRHGVTATP